MLKIKIMAVIALLMSLCVQAGTYIRGHEDFVHLSDHEKNELIIKTMELVVAMESQYNFEVRTYGYDSKRFKKFIEALSKVKSILFIDSAYAAVPTKRRLTDWNSYGNAFKALMEKSGSNCIFAGWPSKPYVKNGLTYCAHPDFIQGTASNRHTANAMAEWTRGYPDPKPDSGCGIDDPKRILCNPTIFGFKNAEKKDLFCVDSPVGAENSSFNCMQEALKDRPAGDPVDSKEKRLTALRASLDSNKDAFAAIQEFAYKSCVCDSTPRNFNRDYQTYMRKHRTCFGLMEMMSAVTCGSNLPLNTSLFESFKNYTNGKIIYNQASGNTLGPMIDYHYENFIKNDVQVTAKAEYDRLCKGVPIPQDVVPPKKEYDCTKATCQTTVTDGVTKFACSSFAITVKGSSETASFDSPPAEVPTAADQRTLEFNGIIAGAPTKLTCPLEIKPVEAPTVVYKCSKATCETKAAVAPSTAATFDCKFEAHEEGKPTPLASFASHPTEKPDAGAVPAEGLKLEIKNKIGTQDVTLSCPLTIIAAKPVDTPPIIENAIEYVCDKATCSASTARAGRVITGIAGQDPPPQAAAFNCDIEAHDKAKPTVKIALKGSPGATPTNDGNSTFAVKIADKDVSLSCKVSMTTAPITPAEEVKPPARRLSGPAQQGPRPPQMMIRQTSDTSAVGIK